MLADLAANLMRIARGSGSPERVRVEITDLAVAFTYMKDEQLRAFPGVVKRVLRRERATDGDSFRTASRAERKQARAEEALLDGALQVVASRILGQRTQESAGDDQIWKALEVLKDS